MTQTMLDRFIFWTRVLLFDPSSFFFTRRDGRARRSGTDGATLMFPWTSSRSVVRHLQPDDQSSVKQEDFDRVQTLSIIEMDRQARLAVRLWRLESDVLLSRNLQSGEGANSVDS